MSPDAITPERLEVPHGAGTIDLWRAAAPGARDLPAVFLLMDAPGLRPALVDMACRIAAEGYLVWLPNLYHRIGRDVSVGPTRDHPDAAANLERMLGWVRTLDVPTVVGDVRHLLDALGDDPAWNRGPTGLTGYCMSGRYAPMAALAEPGRVACAAGYYGTRLVVDGADSPHRVLGACRGELYFAFAEHDPYVPPAHVQALRDALAGGSVRHRIDVYPGTEHGFAFTDRGTYQEAGARRHWDTLFDLLARNLRTHAG